ncbi:MAG: ankyrin repeat domain-containing protein [Desulfobacterales bacterium]|nr:ankyrin repeat domain-containing protein [Desulfobacterales bacterium]
MYGKSKVVFFSLVFFLFPLFTALGADGLGDSFADYEFVMDDLGEICLDNDFAYTMENFDDEKFYLRVKEIGPGLFQYVPQVLNKVFQERIHCVAGAQTHELHIKNLSREEVDYFLKITKEMGEEYHLAIGVFFAPDDATRVEDYVFRRLSEEHNAWFLETRFTVTEAASGYGVRVSLHKKIRENIITVFSDPRARWDAGEREQSGQKYFSARVKLNSQSDNEEQIFGFHGLEIFRNQGGAVLFLKTLPGYWDPQADSGLGAAKVKAIRRILINGKELGILDEIQSGNMAGEIRDYAFLCQLKPAHVDRLKQGKTIRFNIEATNGERYGVEFPLAGSAKAIDQVLEKKVAARKLPPLVAAMEKKDYKYLTALVRSRADVNSPVYKGHPPLALAVKLKDPEMIRILGTAENLDTEWKFPDGDGYLHVAAHYYHGTEVLKALLDIGCSVAIRDKIGRQPLSRAVCYEGFGKLDLLLKSGADVNAVDDSGNSVLHHTASNSYADTTELKYYVDHGGKINAGNQDGDTPFIIAIKNQCWSHVRYLINVSDVNVENRKGQNAYAVAKSYRDAPDLTEKIPMLALADGVARLEMEKSFVDLVRMLEPREYYYIGFREFRDMDPEVRIKYKNDEGRWVDKGWYTFRGRETMLVAKTKHPVFYFYADYGEKFSGVRDPIGLEVMDTGHDDRGGVKIKLGKKWKGKKFFKKL